MGFLLVVGLLVIVAGFVIQKQYGNRMKNMLLWSGLVIIIISLLASTFVQIPAGHRGVVVRFSATTGTVLAEGLQLKIPIIDNIIKMNVQTQKYEADATSASKDLQDVNTTVALNWHLEPDMADDVYRNLGLDYINRLAAPAIQETIKQVTAKYDAEDLILQRDQVKADIEESLANRLRSRGIVAEMVSITNFKFSATFTEAIEAKVSAEQAVLEAENKLLRVRVEALQREAEAKGEADARIAQAIGEAEYIRLVTAAQVQANIDIANSLSPEVLQYILIDRLGKNVQLYIVPDGNTGLVLPQPKAVEP